MICTACLQINRVSRFSRGTESSTACEMCQGYTCHVPCFAMNTDLDRMACKSR